MTKATIRWGWCDENPCRGAPRNPESKRKRLPSDAELAAIHVVAGQQLCCMVDLVLLIGLRKGDLLKIRLSDLTDRGVRIDEHMELSVIVRYSQNNGQSLSPRARKILFYWWAV